MTRRPTADPLLRVWRELLPEPSWHAWELCARTLFGHTAGLSASDAAFVRARIGNRPLPTSQASETYVIKGRRAGGTRFESLLAVYFACFRDYRSILAPGERGTIPLIFPDRRQSRTAMNYILGFIESRPALARMVQHKTKDAIHLANRITIETHTASFRSVRGYTVVFAVVDEACFLPTDPDGAVPDVEILNALRPAMATVPNALLLVVSSPYAKRGAVYDAHKQWFGRDGGPLIWTADTRTMNPTVPASVIKRAFADDATVAMSEYGKDGEIAFRPDIESFVSRETVEGCVVPHRRELPPLPGIQYRCGVDVAGGSGADSFVWVVAHEEPGACVVDLLREVAPPFSPENTAADCAGDCARYGITTVSGDKFGGEWPAQVFSRYGISYRASDKTSSQLFSELLPILNSGRIQLLDHPRAINQLASLERRTSTRGGLIAAPPGGHDDIAVGIATAAAATKVGLGPPRLPSFECLKQAAQPDYFSHASCFLFGGVYFPSDPICHECVGLTTVERLHWQHLARGGDPMHLREFVAQHVRLSEGMAWAALYRRLRENEEAAGRAFDEWEAQQRSRWYGNPWRDRGGPE